MEEKTNPQGQEQTTAPETPESPFDIREPEDTDFAALYGGKAEKPAATSEDTHEEEIPDDLYDRALEAGLTEDDIAEHTSVKELERSIRIADRTMARIGRRGTQQEPPAREQPQTQEQVKAFNLAEKLKALDLDDSYAAVLKELDEYHTSRYEEQQKRLDSFEQLHRQRAQNEFYDQFDGWLAELGEQGEKLFGKGSGGELDNHSKAFRNRVKVLEEMDAMMAGYHATGRQMPSQKAIFNRALRAVFGDKIEATAKEQIRRDVGQRLKRRTSQITAKPTHRNGKELKGEALAAYNLANRLREVGYFATEDN